MLLKYQDDIEKMAGAPVAEMLAGMRLLPARRVGPAIARHGRSKLAENVVHFTRLLRGAGLRLGPASALDALAAASAVDVLQRDELYWALHAVLVKRPEDFDLFDQAFRLFWRDPFGVEAAMAQLLPHVRVPQAPTVSRRVAEAWQPPPPSGSRCPSGPSSTPR